MEYENLTRQSSIKIILLVMITCRHFKVHYLLYEAVPQTSYNRLTLRSNILLLIVFYFVIIYGSFSQSHRGSLFSPKTLSNYQICRVIYKYKDFDKYRDFDKYLAILTNKPAILVNT